MADDLWFPNGMAVTPDGSTLMKPRGSGVTDTRWLQRERVREQAGYDALAELYESGTDPSGGMLRRARRRFPALQLVKAVRSWLAPTALPSPASWRVAHHPLPDDQHRFPECHVLHTLPQEPISRSPHG